MELETLKKRAAIHFNYIALFAVINILTFMGTAVYCGNLEQKITDSGIEKSNPGAYAEQMSSMKMVAISGFAIAIIAIICCMPFVLKRSKIVKQIQAAELDAMEDLDIK